MGNDHKAPAVPFSNESQDFVWTGDADTEGLIALYAGDHDRSAPRPTAENLVAPSAFGHSDGSANRAGGTEPGSGNTDTLSTLSSGAASTSPFVINISWDSSVRSAPSGFTTAVLAAVQFLESQYSDPVTINIAVGYGEVGGSALGSGALGESEWSLTSVGYSSLVNALKADATTATDTTAVASLPSTSPVSGTFWTTTAQAKALGLAPATGSSIDGYVGFSSSYKFTYNDTNGVGSGTYDFNGIVLHEITEVMGRSLLTGETVGSASKSYSLYDLFHYSAPGIRDFSASTPGYFSINGGNTNLAAFNMNSGGDAGDWASSVAHDALDAFSSSGVVNAFSTADLTAMDAIGWNLGAGTGTQPPPPPPPLSIPTGVSISLVTGSLATAQSTNSLAGGSKLATIAQVGGASGDTYTYSLGGSGAAAFTLSNANNAATLAAGAAGVAGSANGRLYALTLTAKDATAGTSSPGSPLDVVVGSSGGDTVQLAALVGAIGSAAPTLIYGLGGSDTINGTGMTGRLWITSGMGADEMTGGSGPNTYIYATASDSTAVSMDVITNFTASKDRLDLTGLGTALKYAGQIGGSRLPSHSVGWQVSGSNTYVYANTSSSNERLSAANMKIDLQGVVSLASNNILHH
jgi:hypothetical protein